MSRGVDLLRNEPASQFSGRAVAVGAIALGSKAAMLLKGAGGLKTLAGLGAAGGMTAAFMQSGDQQQQRVSAEPRIPALAGQARS